jgi:predicted Holliday junction resolvase-like endonuclease
MPSEKPIGGLQPRRSDDDRISSLERKVAMHETQLRVMERQNKSRDETIARFFADIEREDQQAEADPLAEKIRGMKRDAQ